jgi:phosphatidylglycerol---prolipoprotein diacylglyceryl transferase
MDVSMQGIELGPLEIRFYALALITGVIAGALLARVEARRRGLDPDLIWDMTIIGVIAGIIGARLYHVLDTRNIDRYLDDPARIVQVWHGGLGIFGAVIAAVAAVVIYTRMKGQPTLHWVDVGAPALLLGQAIGRWGNYFNQELFGRPTDLPWGIEIPEHRVLAEAPQYLGETHFHPLFLYESILSLIGVGVLLYVARRYAHWLRPGDVLLLYLIWYPATRFMLEFLRAEKWEVGALPAAQLFSLAFIAIAIVLLVWRHRTAEPEPLPEAAAAVEGGSRGGGSGRRRRRRR